MILEGVGAEILNPPFQVWNEYSHVMHDWHIALESDEHIDMNS